MAATTETQKPYAKLLDVLADKDFAVIDDLPKDCQDTKLLHLAWVEGVVEFGRRNYIRTGEPAHDSRHGVTRYIVEPQISWTGPKRVVHKQLKDFIGEDKTLIEPGANVYVQSLEGALDRVHDTKPLRLLVRLTDKGLAVLAA